MYLQVTIAESTGALASQHHISNNVLCGIRDMLVHGVEVLPNRVSAKTDAFIPVSQYSVIKFSNKLRLIMNAVS